mgnify:CR=1 FL=1
MLKSELYPYIFKRKSIRKFNSEPLGQETISDILNFTGSVETLFEDIKWEVRILKPEEITGFYMVKAPHYLALYSEHKDGYLLNAGYILEQIDLYLASKGIGVCWQGGPKLKKPELSSKELVIVLAFGKPKEPLYREDINSFKRKPVNEITDIKENLKLIEDARLAPSAVNRQPWFFKDGGNGEIKICLMTNFFMKKLNLIDMGIVICFLCLSAQSRNIKYCLDFKKVSSVDNMTHLATMSIL